MTETASIERLSLIPLAYLTLFALLWQAIRIPKTNILRSLITWSSIAFVLGFPLIYGRTYYITLDFFLPAMGFLLCMRVYEIMFIRPESETRAWSKELYLCHISAFPLDNVDPMPNLKDPKERASAARWHSFMKIIQCLGKLVVANFLLFLVPSSADMAKLGYYSWPYIVYYYIIGWALYFSFSGVIELIFNITGLIFGVWMKDMFNNPLMASTPRDFWSKRWNLAIKDLFHSILFNTGQRPVDPAVEHKKTDGDKTTANGKTKDSESSKNSTKNKPSSSVQALLAFGVFLFSGLMHEYVNYCAFDILSGENLLYFVLNGIACLIQVSLERTFPSLRHQPRVVKSAFTLCYFLLVGPLFPEPYIRAGFFDSLKSSMLIPVSNVKLFGKY